MRRILVLLIFSLLIIPMTASAQSTPTLAELETSIEKFAVDVASSLPLNASVGLNWSDAYIGQFPHFGVGITVGASTIPFDAATPVLDGLGLTEQVTGSEQLAPLLQFGMPLPAYAVEARLGGLLIPFDIGVKAGIMPPDYELSDLLPNVAAVESLDLDYMNLGFDVRFPVVQERGLIPEISVGGGYNYLRANLGFSGILGDGLIIGSYPNPVEGEPDIEITMSDPTVNYNWSANVLDLKAQVSKGLLFFRPYAGVGASMGFGRAGSGFETVIDAGGITQEQIDQINEAAALLGSGETIPDLSSTSFYLSAPMTGGWSFRAFGGVAINLLIVKVDVNAMYDFLAGNYGATVGVRIQL